MGHFDVNQDRLDHNALTHSYAEDLTSTPRANQSLTDLDLSHNNLGDSGLKILSAALSNPDCKIQKLKLVNNNLRDYWAVDLVPALNTNLSLTDLDLSWNKLGDSTVQILPSALRNQHCKIQKLDLGHNAFTDSCAGDLASSLSTNLSLTDLYLGSNSFTDQSVHALRNLILNCTSLERIQLQENQFSPDVIKQLEMLEGCRSGLSVGAAGCANIYWT
ncbi:NACHT, LRR and PYD domains-containing protein 3-like [Scyliorhinus canicula]|uniref:NACHT, LRR and PYD domains-containing protein 3-like n=1 Tax=Scyliorhinus canicula TaxID=7830 RepID=UPI0018F4392F|nr:NACHT, LRR and PYD domains-containing protein 3-like [Scyliorhinus canicula]